MLLELRIKDLAIISSTTLQFGEGLHVFTGETGAGKSILLAALDLVLGGRSDRGKIRRGQKKAWVEALFLLEPSALPLLRSWGIDAEPMEPLALRRVIYESGRSRAYINSISVPASHLRQLAPLLVSFGRQHDQNALLQPTQHLELLDRFAGCDEERAEVEARYETIYRLEQEFRELEEEHVARQERLEFLQFQYDAIEAVNPQPDEWEALTQELAQLNENEEEKKRIGEITELLLHSDESIQAQLSHALQQLARSPGVEAFDDTLHDELHQSLLVIEESARTLQAYQRTLDSFPQRAQEIEDRLAELHQLHQKYGGDWDAVFSRLDQLDEEIQELHAQNAREKELVPLLTKARRALWEATRPLSRKRREAAEVLSERIEAELADLAMPGARFRVDFQPLGSHEGIACAPDANKDDDLQVANARGAERGAFLLAANPGEGLRPLERVASGGELSRILLALRRVLTDITEVSTLIFDEIDAGVAGAAATQIARKLRQIVVETKTQPDCPMQLICITHTPQIASEADHHFLIQKEVKEGRTHSSVQRIDHDDRVREIARMLAGEQSLEQALELARELLEPPKSYAIAS